MRAALRAAGLALGLVAGQLGSASAAPPRALDEVLGPATVAPTAAELVPLQAPPPAPSSLKPEDLASDPAALVRFVEANPDRLAVAQMDPALVLTLVQLLLRADKTFIAEKLLHDAHLQWPDRADLARGWARVLISLGRPDRARLALAAAQRLAPEDPVVRYLEGRACLASLPVTPAKEACARAAFQAVLALDPGFQDSDGVQASDLEALLGRLGRPGAAQGL